LTALLIIGALAGLAIAGLVVGICAQSRTILRMGNQLIANSDLQIERIRHETRADQIRDEERPDPVRWNPPPIDEAPDMSIPSRG
jgi:hypothetical protein